MTPAPHAPTQSTLASRLRRRRDELRMVPEMLAAAAEIVPDQYATFEEGRAFPTAEQLIRIAGVLNMKPAALLEGVPRPTTLEVLAAQTPAPMPSSSSAPKVPLQLIALAQASPSIAEGDLVVPKALVACAEAGSWTLREVATLVRLRTMLAARGRPSRRPIASTGSPSDARPTRSLAGSRSSSTSTTNP